MYCGLRFELIQWAELLTCLTMVRFEFYTLILERNGSLSGR